HRHQPTGHPEIPAPPRPQRRAADEAGERSGEELVAVSLVLTLGGAGWLWRTRRPPARPAPKPSEVFPPRRRPTPPPQQQRVAG
ncbi:hypothetical protein ACWC5G_25990, partial [Streptomyces sp. NPDC001274]